MQSLFFRLPQELRDQIYKYALYDSEGLFYVTCEDGIDRLCTRKTARSRRRVIISWLHRSSYSRARKKRKKYCAVAQGVSRE
jgi:hypothetical protein